MITKFKKLIVPYWWLGGTADEFFSESIFRKLASKVKNCQLKLLEGEHHMVPVEQAGKIKKIVLGFLVENW